jgi:hypothetical protein
LRARNIFAAAGPRLTSSAGTFRPDLAVVPAVLVELFTYRAGHARTRDARAALVRSIDFKPIRLKLASLKAGRGMRQKKGAEGSPWTLFWLSFLSSLLNANPDGQSHDDNRNAQGGKIDDEIANPGMPRRQWNLKDFNSCREEESQQKKLV